MKKRWIALLTLSLAGLPLLPRTSGPKSTSLLSLPARQSPLPPSGGEALAPGVSLQARLDQAGPGAVFRLAPGIYRGPLVINRPVTLWGPPSAVIQSNGEGHTIKVLADHVRLLGFSIAGSGKRYDKQDGAVYVQGRDVLVQGLTIKDALFGLLAERSARITFQDNRIIGDPGVTVGLRGDAIRLWETRESRVTGNQVDYCRDIVVWYSPNNRVERNFVRQSRYGTHFMYSSDSTAENNTYLQNVVGIFVMYSHNLRLRRNTLAGNTDGDGMALGLKESGNITLEANRFIKDHLGLYVDNSPLNKNESNTVRNNLFALCDSAVVFHSAQKRNTFVDNTFRANREQVAVEGRGDALEVGWHGNYFDDYQGYDLDGDGLGDVPYELHNMTDSLIGEHDDLAFFRGSAAFGILDALSTVFPLFPSKTLLIDPKPRMRPAEAANAQS